MEIFETKKESQGVQNQESQSKRTKSRKPAKENRIKSFILNSFANESWLGGGFNLFSNNVLFSWTNLHKRSVLTHFSKRKARWKGQFDGWGLRLFVVHLNLNAHKKEKIHLEEPLRRKIKITVVRKQNTLGSTIQESISNHF